MDEELKKHIAASVAQIDQDRHNIHKLAEDLKNAIPHIGLEAFEKSIRKLQLEFRLKVSKPLLELSVVKVQESLLIG